jgi:hypothetical protein
MVDPGNGEQSIVSPGREFKIAAPNEPGPVAPELFVTKTDAAFKEVTALKKRYKRVAGKNREAILAPLFSC